MRALEKLQGITNFMTSAKAISSYSFIHVCLVIILTSKNCKSVSHTAPLGRQDDE
jgi:hypothetical protein